MKVSKEQVAAHRARILAAAARLFRLRGFEDVTVAEVMKEAGLTHGAFYGHFPVQGGADRRGDRTGPRPAADGAEARMSGGGLCRWLSQRATPRRSRASLPVLVAWRPRPLGVPPTFGAR